MRLLKIVGVFAIAICLTGMVYAETQSVKISGDLTVRSIMRDDYDLDHNHQENTTTTRTGSSSDWQTYFMTTTEVQIDADLTDNVAGVIRLYNQRDWNVRDKSLQVSTRYNGGAGYTATDDEFDVGVDLAYIELKEFLYSPLTLTIGRQDLWFGKGFIVGANRQDPQGTINADEYTCVNSFDAVRATLDYDPWTIDFVAAKIQENDIQSDDDEDLYGANVGYMFDDYNAEAEGYWFSKVDNTNETWNIKDGDTVHTIGLRGSMDPIENWTVDLETAYQFGRYIGSRTQTVKRDRSAWALDAAVECRHFVDQFAWKPKIGVEYIFYSGNKDIDDENEFTTGDYTGWDRMYRGKYDSKIREWQGILYQTNQDLNNQKLSVNPMYMDRSDTNQHQLIVSGTIEPTDSLTVDTRYINFWQQYETYHLDPARTLDMVKDDGYLGSEIDVEVTWDYTEDVTFGVLSAWYFPGSHYYDQSDDIAQDIVGSVSLSF